MNSRRHFVVATYCWDRYTVLRNITCFYTSVYCIVFKYCILWTPSSLRDCFQNGKITVLWLHSCYTMIDKWLWILIMRELWWIFFLLWSYFQKYVEVLWRWCFDEVWYFIKVPKGTKGTEKYHFPSCIYASF